MNIILNGALGKMGRAIKNISEKKYKDIKIYEADIKEVEGISPIEKINVSDANVVIDFSSINGTKSALEYCVKKKIPAVIGTTGLGEDMMDLMKKYSSEIPVFYSPNMSMGVNICLCVIDFISKKIDADIHIHETHHKMKKDAPSGTAVMFKKIIENNNRKVAVTSARISDIIGEHEITFGLDGEKIVISHTAYSRDIFAEGALKAAMWLCDKPSGFYSFKDMLNLNF